MIDTWSTEYASEPHTRFSLLSTADRRLFYWGRIMLQRLNTLELMALLIRAEADDQPEAGKLAVAWTVVERVDARPWRYGTNLRAVMLKPAQYSCFNEERHWKRFYEPESPLFLEAFGLAIGVICGERPNPAAGATHYYNPSLAKPYWADPKYAQFVAQIGDHVFMREIV